MDSQKDSENNLFSEKTKSTNVFDWEEEEAAGSLTDDTFSLPMSSKSSNLHTLPKQPQTDSSFRFSLRSTEQISEPPTLHKMSSSFDLSQTCHKSSELNLKSLPNADKSKKTYSPIKDSFKNILHKSINIERFKLNLLANSSRPIGESIPISRISSSQPKLNHIAYGEPSFYLSADLIMQKVINNQPYTFIEFQSLKDKEKLLISAIQTCHSSCIIKVVLFLRETLKTELFKNMLEKYSEASNEYNYFLKSLDQFDTFERLTVSIKHDRIESKPTLAQLIFDYRKIISTKFTKNTLGALEAIYIKYNNSQMYRDYVSAIKMHIDSLKLQFINKSCQTRKNLLPMPIPEFALDKSLIENVYCWMTEYLQETPYIPHDLQKVFGLGDIQFEYIIVKACCSLKLFDRLRRYYIEKPSVGIFKSKIPPSSTTYDNICYLLNENDAPEEIISQYINYIPDKNIQLDTAENLYLYEQILRILMEMKDKDKIRQLVQKVASDENMHRKIIHILTASNIEWT